MNYYERCQHMTHFSVSDYLGASEEVKQKFQFYDLNTMKSIPDWNNLSPLNENMLSLIHQYLQVFDYDEVKAVKAHNLAKQKASKVVDQYLEKHLFAKLDPKHPDTFPIGISAEEFERLLKDKARVLHDHIFHKEFVEKHFYWKLENELFVNYLDA